MKRAIVIAIAVSMAFPCMALTPTPGRTATEKWAWAASAEQTTNIVTRQFVEDLGITGGGVTPAVATNIAGQVSTNVVTDKVADWAMKGQPRPSGEGITTNAVKDITSSAAVTNAGAVASAKAYADGTFLPLNPTNVETKITLPYNDDFRYSISFTDTEYPDDADIKIQSSDDSNSCRILICGGRLEGERLENNFDWILDKAQGVERNKVSLYSYLLNTYLGKTDKAANADKLDNHDSSYFATATALAQKADRAVPSASGNFASLDAQGNLQDSGKKASDFASASALNECLPKSGGNMSGDINFDNGGASVVFGLAGGGLSFNNGGTRVSIYMDEEYPRDLMFSLVNEEQGEYTEETSHLTIDGSPFLTQTTGDARYELRGGGGGGVTPQVVTNIVTNVVSQAYIRQKLGVYLYVGPDNGIYVHVE